MRSEILLIRHGETLWNGEGRIQGHRDSPLSALGRAQAAAVGARLAREGIDHLASSDLGRALATAAAVADATDLEIFVDARLRERAYGELEGMTWAEIERERPADFARLKAHDPDFRPARGESLMDFRERVLATLGELARAAAGARAAIVTHGGVLGVLYREVKGIPWNAPRDYPLANASINRFVLEAGAWRLEHWGDVDHLDTTLDDWER
ncbi:MAG: histidine phosphatase family protein [Burkholderiales bacterium]|nr:histidine phosphatase family protein [Burkholderiales bacterium]